MCALVGLGLLQNDKAGAYATMVSVPMTMTMCVLIVECEHFKRNEMHMWRFVFVFLLILVLCVRFYLVRSFFLVFSLSYFCVLFLMLWLSFVVRSMRCDVCVCEYEWESVQCSTMILIIIT